MVFNLNVEEDYDKLSELITEEKVMELQMKLFEWLASNEEVIDEDGDEMTITYNYEYWEDKNEKI